MPKKRHQPARLAPLPRHAVDVLLTGVCLAEAKVVPAAERAAYDFLYEFAATPVELAALWHEHRGALMVEWARRGTKGRPWGARFDRVRPADP